MHRDLSRLAEARYSRVLLKNVEIIINDNYSHRRRLYRQLSPKADYHCPHLAQLEASMGPIPRVAFGRIRLATIIVSVGLLTGIGAVLAQDDVDQPEQEQGTVPEAASDTASAPVALP